MAARRDTLDLGDVVAEQKLTNKALKFAKQLAVTDREDAKKRRMYARLLIFSLIGIVVGFFVSGVYSQRFRYPKLFHWWDAMRREPTQGAGKHNYSMYQVCVAANFTPVQTMLEAATIWKHLTFKGANFLQQCVVHFEKLAKEDPRAKLTSLHWCGSKDQTQYSKLLGNDGWASGGCKTTTLTDRQNTLVRNWVSSRGENIWYYMLPQPTTQFGRTQFLSVPMIRELYTDSTSSHTAENACNADSFWTSKLGMLFSGGLCYVAFEETAANQSSADLFNAFFSANVNVRASCAGAVTAGAAQGGMSGAMGGMSIMMTVPTTAGVIAGVAMSIGGAIMGAVAGGAASKETCEQEQDMNPG